MKFFQRVMRHAEDTASFQINAVLNDDPEKKDYYQFFTRVGATNRQYLAAFLGCIDDVILDSVAEIPVFKGHQLQVWQYSSYFKYNDTVSVKIAHIDETSYRIWNSCMESLTLSNNMFLTTSSNVESNIVGGYGYWCGYNSTADYFVIGCDSR